MNRPLPTEEQRARINALPVWKMPTGDNYKNEVGVQINTNFTYGGFPISVYLWSTYEGHNPYGHGMTPAVARELGHALIFYADRVDAIYRESQP